MNDEKMLHHNADLGSQGVAGILLGETTEVVPVELEGHIPSVSAADFMLVELNLTMDIPQLSGEVSLTRADYLNASTLVTRQEYRDKRGKKRERIGLTDSGKAASEYIGLVLHSETVTTREGFEALNVSLGETYEQVKASLGSVDKAQRSAQLTAARQVLADVRFNALKQYKQQEKEANQAEARSLITTAVGHLGLAHLTEKNNVDLVSLYLSDYYKADKTRKRKSLVATARSIAYHELGKRPVEEPIELAVEQAAPEPVTVKEEVVEEALQAEPTVLDEPAQAPIVDEPEVEESLAEGEDDAQVESEVRNEPELPEIGTVEVEEPEPEVEAVAESAEPKAKAQEKPAGRAERALRTGSTIIGVAAALAVGGYVALSAAQRAEASSIRRLASVVPPQQPETSKGSAKEAVAAGRPERQPVPVTITESGPIDYTLSYTVNGQRKMVNLGLEGSGRPKTDYRYYAYTPETMNAVVAKFIADRRGMKDHQLYAINLGDVLFTEGESAWALSRLALGNAVDAFNEAVDPKTGELKGGGSAFLEKTGKTGQKEYDEVVKWMLVPVSQAQTLPAHIAYVRQQLGPEVKFTGITKTCFIPRGKIVGKPEFYLTLVTNRITENELPPDYRPRRNQQGEHYFAEGDPNGDLSGSRNPNKGKNRAEKTPWELTRGRQARIMAMR